jgi:hypothetical protein
MAGNGCALFRKHFFKSLKHADIIINNQNGLFTKYTSHQMLCAGLVPECLMPAFGAHYQYITEE